MEATIFDLEGALNRLGGDRELFQDVVGFFLEDSPGLLEQVRQGFAAGDAETVHRAAHSLKGLAAQLGGARAVDAARAVEAPARPQSDMKPEPADLKTARANFPALEREITLLQEAVAPYQHQTN
mgnify:CR=1 FL=1